MIGLGTAKQTTSSTNRSVYTPQFGDSPFGQWLAQHPTALNFSFGMALNPPRSAQRGNGTSTGKVSGEANGAGILHWLQPDPSAYDSTKLVWRTVNNSITPQLPVSGNATSGADWFLDMDGWVMTAGNNHLSNTAGIIATVDSLYPELYLPASQAKLIRTCLMFLRFHDLKLPASHVLTQMTLYLDPSSELTLQVWARCPRRIQSPAVQHILSASSSGPRRSLFRPAL